MKKSKFRISCIFNYNPLYRFPIYYEMSQRFECDFYFGDNIFEKLKQFDAKELPGFQTYLKAKRIGNSFIWYNGICNIFKKDYSTFILTGSPGIIANWLIILYAKLFQKKLFCWCHGPKTHHQDFLTKILTIPFFKSMDGIFLYCDYNKQFMLPWGIDESRIHIIHNSLNTKVQTEIFNSIKPSSIYRDHFGNSNPVIIFIGRIQKRMKVHLLVEAVYRLKESGLYTNLVLVGPYLDGENIEELVRCKKMENQTWFYGASYDEETTSKLLYNADVCVAPGTVGLTAIHSLSYGTPVITHNNFSNIGPEFEAIIENKTGDFFQEDDVDSLACCIQKWINLPPIQRQEIRNLARNVIENFWSVDYQINILNTVLRNENIMD